MARSFAGSGALAASGQDPAELDGVHVDVLTAGP
jgi:hypothetical protein